MKLLKLEIDDMELYNVENTTLKADYLFANMPAFRKLYANQGETFWIRHILTLREYLYMLIHCRFELEEGQCLHWIINMMEKIFIRIHRLLIVGGFDQAKKNIKIIKKTLTKFDLISHYITNRQFRLITSKSVKLAFRTLFGSHLGHDKKAVIKAFIACGIYEHFCGSLGVLLKRCSTAIDMPSSFSDSPPNVQYWKPFPHWTQDDYEPNLFENYMASYYGDELSKILLVADALNLFSHNALPKCCVAFIENYGAKLLSSSNSPLYVKRIEYISCEHHRGCHIRVVHSDSCMSPYFSCLNLPYCIWHCDTFCTENSKQLTKKKKGLWKCHAIEVHKNSVVNFRDVSTQEETVDSNVQTYLCREIHESDGSSSDNSSDSPFMKSLPPDLINIAKQIKQKEKTKSRLRDKLFKKSKRETKVDDIFHSQQLENFEDYEYCSALYLKAQKKLHEELGEDLLYKFFGNKIGQSDSPLMDLFEEHFNMEKLCYTQNHTSTSVKSNYRSIGVGCDIPLDIKFLSTPKTFYFKNRVKKKLNAIGVSNILLTSDATDTDKKTAEFENFSHSQDNIDAATTEKKLKNDIIVENTEMPTSNVDKIDVASDEKKPEHLTKNKKSKKSKKKADKKLKKETSIDTVQLQENGVVKTLTEQLENSVTLNNTEPILADCNENTLQSADTVQEVQSNYINKSSEKQMEPKPLDENKTIVESPSSVNLTVSVNNNKHNLTDEKNDVMSIVDEKKINCIENFPETEESNIAHKIAIDHTYHHPGPLNEATLNYQDNEKISQSVQKENVIESKQILNAENNAVLGNGEEKLLQVMENSKKVSKLRVCACCAKLEPARKTFKKCKLCKAQNFEVQRYYCSVECQEIDWKKKHKFDHRNRPSSSTSTIVINNN